MSFWQFLGAVGQTMASRRNSRQLQAMSRNKFFSGSTAGQKIDRYGRLASQLSQVRENSDEQTAKSEYIDSWRTHKPTQSYNNSGGNNSEYIDSWRKN